VFSVGIVGGRKTMSAALQQAAVFFPSDAVYHVVYAGDESDAPRTLPDVERDLSHLHLIRVIPHYTQWHLLMHGSWDRQFPGVPRNPDAFPLRREVADRYVIVEAEVSRQDESGRLLTALNEVASLAAVFASPESLAAGLGGQFLRHDLSNLFAGLRDDPVFSSLDTYLGGLRRLLDREAAGSLKWHVLEGVCHHALILALGRYVPTLVAAKSLRVELAIEPETTSLTTPGMDEGLLLVAMRNLLANVRKHGTSEEEWDEPIARVRLTQPEERLVCLEVRNRLPREAKLEGDLRRLLLPRMRGPNSDGDGLGLFTVAEVARHGAIDPPTIEIDNGDFIVRLCFPC
jgi:hypothetical protein